MTVDPYEQHKYAATLNRLPARRFRRILDVGCSKGTFTYLAARAYPDAEVIGVDTSERALHRARVRSGHLRPAPRFLLLDMLTQAPAGLFDLVFCSEVLYYWGRESRLRQEVSSWQASWNPAGLSCSCTPGRTRGRSTGPSR